MGWMRRCCLRPLGVLMCQLLAWQLVTAQSQATLRVVVVAGQGAKNLVQQIPPDPLAVRVEENNRPVAGAAVTLTAPMAGPTGQFANGAFITTATTDGDGVAVIQGFHPNATVGSYQIQVRAEFRGQTATTSIRQSNVTSAKGHGKLIAILAVAGAAAGAVLIAKSGGNSGSTAPTITLGDSAVGAPKP